MSERKTHYINNTTNWTLCGIYEREYAKQLGIVTTVDATCGLCRRVMGSRQSVIAVDPVVERPAGAGQSTS